MEALNDGSKAIAKVLELLLAFDNLHPNHEQIELSINILEEALNKITKKM